ncbi:MAG: hypothetical protein R6V36_07810 [Psychroflexus sp.]
MTFSPPKPHLFDIYMGPKAEAYNYFECKGTPHWIVLGQSLNQYRSIFGSQDQAQQRLWYAIESLRN